MWIKLGGTHVSGCRKNGSLAVWFSCKLTRKFFLLIISALPMLYLLAEDNRCDTAEFRCLIFISLTAREAMLIFSLAVVLRILLGE